MAYATYTTEVIVCGTFSKNTADASYLLFTREAGMLYADAKSVREERSKQRFALQDFSLARVSLVKGKVGWRIGSIEAVKNYYQQSQHKAGRGQVVSTVRLIRRFLKGEEPNQELFDLVKSGLALFTLPESHPNQVAELVQLRMLALLGYVDRAQIPNLVRDCSVEEIPNHYVEQHKAVIDRLYTQAVTSSQL